MIENKQKFLELGFTELSGEEEIIYCGATKGESLIFIEKKLVSVLDFHQKIIHVEWFADNRFYLGSSPEGDEVIFDKIVSQIEQFVKILNLSESLVLNGLLDKGIVLY